MKDQITTIQEIKDKIAKFVNERDWNKFHSPKNLAMSIAIEAGELMEIFQWLSQEEAWDINSTHEATHLREELSDVIIYCISCKSIRHRHIFFNEDKIRKNAKYLL